MYKSVWTASKFQVQREPGHAQLELQIALDRSKTARGQAEFQIYSYRLTTERALK